MAAVDVVQHLVGCVVVAVVDVGGYVQFVALTAIVRCGLEKQLNLIVTQLGQFGLIDCLCVCLFVCTFLSHLTVCPSASVFGAYAPLPPCLFFVCLFVWQAVCLSLCLCLSLCVFVCLSVCLSVCICLCLPVSG